MPLKIIYLFFFFGKRLKIIYRVMLIDTFYVTKKDIQFRFHHTYCHKYQFLESIEKNVCVYIYIYILKTWISTGFRINRFSFQSYSTCHATVYLLLLKVESFSLTRKLTVLIWQQYFSNFVGHGGRISAALLPKLIKLVSFSLFLFLVF